MFWNCVYEFRACKSVHHHNFNWINQPNAEISQIYYLSFKYSSTCFWASSCPSSGAQQLQQQPLVYRWNVVIALLLVVVGPAGQTTTNSNATTTLQRWNLRLLLQLLSSRWRAGGRARQSDVAGPSAAMRIATTARRSNKPERMLHLVGWFIWMYFPSYVDISFQKMS
jgi:hypothetical protein